MNISVLMDLLKDEFRLVAATNGEQALERVLAGNPPDLILLDIMMPGMDGYEVCQRIKADENVKDIPIIFISAMGQMDDEMKGLDLGAVDYITKPISPPIVKARVKTHLTLKEAREFLADQNAVLEKMVRKRTEELVATQEVTILSMTTLAETRDNETGNHIRRTQHYVKVLAEQLRDHENFRDGLDDRTIDLLFKSAPLHDIGKVGIPDNILLKPGKLTSEEFETMKLHPVYGRDAILSAEEALHGVDGGDKEASFLRYAREISYSHHEKWDGSGYPEGLSGSDIPLSARLMAVADVYDALICKRVYKPPFTYEEAESIILEGKGKHFDPDVVDAFVEVQERFKEIANTFAD